MNEIQTDQSKEEDYEDALGKFDSDKIYEFGKKVGKVLQSEIRSYISHLESEAAFKAATEIKKRAFAEIDIYLESADYKEYVEGLKRKRRIEAIQEVEAEIEIEKQAMLSEEKARLLAEKRASDEAHEILRQNRLKIEEQQRKAFESKQVQDAQRLEEIKLKVRVACL